MIVAANAVPQVNSARDREMKDVIGNKLDTHIGTSIASFARRLDDHHHSPAKVYPTLGDGVAVAGGAGVWALSAAFIEIMPALATSEPFDIHHISIEDLDDNTNYELVIYAVEVEIGRTRFTKNANLDGGKDAWFQCKVQPAGTQIQAKLASKVGNSNATIALLFHDYD